MKLLVVNLQSLWIEQNPTQYEEAKKRRDDLDARLKIQVGLESVQVKKLDSLYIEYSDIQLAIDNIDNIPKTIKEHLIEDKPKKTKKGDK